jgi:hypothetical protein
MDGGPQLVETFKVNEIQNAEYSKCNADCYECSHENALLLPFVMGAV